MGMIKSERELTISKNLVKQIEESSYSVSKDVDPRLRVAALMAPQAFKADIQEQIEEYENIQKGKIPKYFFEIENLGLLLIALRIKNGFSQTELAERLGVPQSQVSRDENNDYHGVGLNTVLKILKALDETLEIKLK